MLREEAFPGGLPVHSGDGDVTVSERNSRRGLDVEEEEEEAKMYRMGKVKGPPDQFEE